MSFVTKEFAILIIVVLSLILLINNPQIRKVILLSASCFFYAYWDWRFLGLLVLVTILDYYVSVFLVRSTSNRTRKLLLTTSLVVNLGLLAIFKYFNFFIGTFNTIFEPLGWNLSTVTIILPIGISFYTFETLSYVIDVYRGNARPAHSLLDYAIFITFFPRLVAGPIMRATQFLPQLEKGIHLNYENIISGSQLFLRGMIKKLVLADNAAIMVDQVYSAPSVFSPTTVWMAVGAYSVQILCDFWGYTDMARGIARILGFELPLNFDLPYTAQSITEFWNRWHISLSTWLRDYLYIPLGGNRKGKVRTHINLMITMLLGGLWHGASWNFVLWGGLHGSYLVIEKLLFGNRPAQTNWTSPKAWFKAMFVFLLVSITWVPFRSQSFETTIIIFQKLAFLHNEYQIEWHWTSAMVGLFIVLFGGFLARRFKFGWPILRLQHSYTIAIMMMEIIVIFFFSPVSASPFIYFQF